MLIIINLRGDSYSQKHFNSSDILSSARFSNNLNSMYVIKLESIQLNKFFLIKKM